MENSALRKASDIITKILEDVSASGLVKALALMCIGILLMYSGFGGFKKTPPAQDVDVTESSSSITGTTSSPTPLPTPTELPFDTEEYSAKMKIVTDAIDASSSYADSGDYNAALSVLSMAIEELGGNKELESKYAEYNGLLTEHISQKAMVAATDYYGVGDIISAISILQTCEYKSFALKQLLDKYESEYIESQLALIDSMIASRGADAKDDAFTVLSETTTVLKHNNRLITAKYNELEDKYRVYSFNKKEIYSLEAYYANEVYNITSNTGATISSAIELKNYFGSYVILRKPQGAQRIELQITAGKFEKEYGGPSDASCTFRVLDAQRSQTELGSCKIKRLDDPRTVSLEIPSEVTCVKIMVDEVPSPDWDTAVVYISDLKMYSY